MSHDNESLGERLGHAAIEAEFETGVHEATVEDARSHIVVRVAVIGAGFVLLLVGLALLVLPGPGALVVAAGLMLLAKEVPWAARMLAWLRHKTPGIPADGEIPKSTIVQALLVTTAAILAGWAITTKVDIPWPG